MKDPYRRYNILFVILAIFPVPLSLICILVSPTSFYYRSWEYFLDFPFKNPAYPPVWKGNETGDLSRDNFFYYQTPHYSEVSTDRFGFRSVPKESDNYPIVVAGDSTVFGAGLSDAETVPWQVAELLDTPVYNGAETNLRNLLAHPLLQNTRVIIEIKTERSLIVRHKEKLERGAKFWSRIRNQPAPAWRTIVAIYRRVPFQRYYLPGILFRTVQRMLNDARLFLSRQEPEEYLYFPHRINEDSLEKSFQYYLARARQVTALGYQYVLVPVPAKQTIYKKDVPELDRNFVPRLVARLKAHGVNALDLTAVFLKHKDEGIYFPTDTHWNPKGTKLAAEEVARYLQALVREEKLSLDLRRPGESKAPVPAQ